VLVDLVQGGAGEVVGVGQEPIGGVALVAGKLPRSGLRAVDQAWQAAAQLDVAGRFPQVPGAGQVAPEQVEAGWLLGGFSAGRSGLG
jgi:hypothetical protein